MHYRYRINGGEILGESTTAYPTNTYFGSYEPASTPDGTDMSVPKVKNGTAMQNATALQISNFPIYAAQDADAELKARAIAVLSPNNEKDLAVRGLMLKTMDAVNAIRNAVELSPENEATWISDITTKVNAESVPALNVEP